MSAPPTPPSTPPDRSRRLYRSRRDRVVSGVCAGLGHYFGLDPVIVRLAFVLFTLAGGAGLLAYLILAIVVPQEDPALGDLHNSTAASFYAGGARRTGPLGGMLLIGVGLIMLANNLGVTLAWVPWFSWHLVWPVALIALGAVILTNRSRTAG